MAREAPFENAQALIFGAARNIGRAVALEFARRGAAVAVADIDLAGAEETAQLIIDAGGKAVAIRCDVTDDEAVVSASSHAIDQIGEIDIVMNNAGVLHSGNPEDIPTAEWQRTINCNLMGCVRANNVFMPRMIARGRGHIVNTASVAGLYPYAIPRIAYAASKAAIISMSENLALYLEPLGVRVSCLCPGPTMTTMLQGMKVFTPDAVMRGPGSELKVISQEALAVTLADGMRDGRILIPTHSESFETIRRRGDDPDGFVRAKITEFAAGNSGLPPHWSLEEGPKITN